MVTPQGQIVTVVIKDITDSGSLTSLVLLSILHYFIFLAFKMPVI